MAHTSWLLLVYRVPTDPASKRVTIWRDLKRLGSLYLQQCVCILPDRDDLRAEIERIAEKIESFDGEHTLFEIPHLRRTDQKRIIESFQSLRNKEYQEIIEECETKFVKEVEFEQFRENYSFEEAEEIGQDLDKIRRWFDRIVNRDWFGASLRQEVEVWIDRCSDLLTEFEHEVYARNPDDAPDEASRELRFVVQPRVMAQDEPAARSADKGEETGT